MRQSIQVLAGREERETQRLRLSIRGAVQGVGFRPFVYRLARDLGLTGWVNNSPQGVFVEVEGEPAHLEEFLRRLEREKPPRASIQSLEPVFLGPVGYTTFAIRASEAGGGKTALILPDIATCPDCLREIFDPANRRYLYPFTNCTNCGPRYSIIEGLPYDRSRTTMRRFAMCAQCRAEYEDPGDRHFHAQPNACPRCGPHLELWDRNGRVLADRYGALLQAAGAVRDGLVVAVKGLGGFHLLVDARRAASVLTLRQRKAREEKPFAVMFPRLTVVRQSCEVSDHEARLLCSPEAPIVLLKRRPQDSRLTLEIAPGNPYLGALLPYTPLHHLLVAELDFPVVATSGNLAEEPICTNEHEALERLGGLADLFLVHDRPIARHMDDSVVRVVLDRELVLRRARGYAPLPLPLPEPAPPLLAVGGHLKNVVVVAAGGEAFVSQHIGDLDTAPAVDAFRRVIADWGELYDFRPAAVACDAHPDYRSTQYARQTGLPVVAVQHHYAHVLACMAENGLRSCALGVCWDGTGYGPDGTIWGGEFLRVTESGFERVAHLRTFGLPGGEKAVREPRRAALGLLYEFFGDALFTRTGLAPVQSFTGPELTALRGVLARRVNTPRTSSAGRLFDAVASLLGLRQESRFEGQAAMDLEFTLAGSAPEGRYAFAVLEPADGQAGAPHVLDWGPVLAGILDDLARGLDRGTIAARFHDALVEAIIAVARQVGEQRVVLTGGCFQNCYLTERAVLRLEDEGFRPYWHQRLPPNDGGLAVGQAVAAARELRGRA